MITSSNPRLACFLATAALFAAPFSVQAQLFENLRAFGNRLDVGDPATSAHNRPGPKGICKADFNDDGKMDLAVGNIDGVVSVLMGNGDGSFQDAVNLVSGSESLRGIICHDLTGDGAPDIAVAAPFDAKIYLFANNAGSFSIAPTSVIDTWEGARNLAAGDFDGDGKADLAVAGPRNGLRHYRGLGGGSFETAVNISALDWTEDRFPRPVYSLRVSRPAGEIKDQLHVTHAEGGELWHLKANAEGLLEIDNSLTVQRARSFAIGPVASGSGSGINDLVTAQRDSGNIHVHLAAPAAGAGEPNFQGVVSQVITVPGGPRALELVDLDLDGWNDLVVVLRNFDRVITYKNYAGIFQAESEAPVGRSPRELVTADFNSDNYPDLAVINRRSSDVSVLLTSPGEATYSVLDQVYANDGEVTSLKVEDFNGDGRDDVIQTHKTSWDISVRLANEDGTLSPPVYQPIGEVPAASEITDLNADGVTDLVTVNLEAPGSISVRYGRGDGTFDHMLTFYLPPNQAGGLISVAVADFDGDGIKDLASGYRDCRLSLFRGQPDGSYVHTHSHSFVHEPLDMVTADFDQDGDIDIAGVGYEGDIVIVENEGDLLDTDSIERHRYQHDNHFIRWSQDIALIDINEDGWLDLMAGSDGGVLFLTNESTTGNMQFSSRSIFLDGFPTFPATSLVQGDFDEDGVMDVAISCQILSCITIMTSDKSGQRIPGITVDVPSGEFLATGDLDGDGHLDLVGSGATLWTALSGTLSESTPSGIEPNRRTGLGKPVINEFLASNLTLETAPGRTSDWVEIYNDSAVAIDLRDWQLQLTKDETNEAGEPVTEVYRFPGIELQPGAHLVITCSRNVTSQFHTGFKLPAEGGTLCLCSADGVPVDRVEYGPQLIDVSYSRFGDGLPSFRFNHMPDPGAPNIDNGPVPPGTMMRDFELSSLGPNQPTRFYAQGWDDEAIVSLSLMWRRTNVPEQVFKRVVLYDDSLHQDKESQDGFFSGVMDPLEEDTEIEFYLEVVDLSDNIVFYPEAPGQTLPGEPTKLLTLSVNRALPGLEISEVVSSNKNGLRDENGGTPDYVEIRNVSNQAIPLAGVTLCQAVFDPLAPVFTFPVDMTLEAGAYAIVFCDRDPHDGPLHADFKIKNEGEALFLSTTTALGSVGIIDSVFSGKLGGYESLSRTGPDAPWAIAPPTPGTQNAPKNGYVRKLESGGMIFVYPSEPGETLRPEYSSDLGSGSWIEVDSVEGDGFEKSVTLPPSGRGFLRVRK